MDTELRERFEEAAKEYAERELNKCAGSDWRRGDVRIEMLMSFEDGAEYGYKEAIKMAEWKDEQFKEYLEKKKAKMKEKHASYSSAVIQASNAGGILTIDEIINELFPND